MVRHPRGAALQRTAQACGLQTCICGTSDLPVVPLAVGGKFEGKKDVKQALLEPAVAEWWAEQPVTREARQNNG